LGLATLCSGATTRSALRQYCHSFLNGETAHWAGPDCPDLGFGDRSRPVEVKEHFGKEKRT
jgi:hypothetical protein